MNKYKNSKKKKKIPKARIFVTLSLIPSALFSKSKQYTSLNLLIGLLRWLSWYFYLQILSLIPQIHAKKKKKENTVRVHAYNPCWGEEPASLAYTTRVKIVRKACLNMETDLKMVQQSKVLLSEDLGSDPRTHSGWIINAGNFSSKRYNNTLTFTGTSTHMCTYTNIHK